MTFTLNCQSYEPKIRDIKVAPPFGTIKLNNTCKASNTYLQLPDYFGKHSHFERSDPVNLDDNQNNNSWTFVAIIIVASALAVIVVVWLIARKRNCYSTQIIGKRQVNMHELEEVNVKQTLSNGDDIEMSALIEQRNVVNSSEGQQNSFRQTDALAAWTQAWTKIK